MTTNRFIFALISIAGLVLLWAAPILTSKGFNTSWFAIDLCILMGTYLMLAYPGLFGAIARRKKQLTCRAMA